MLKLKKAIEALKLKKTEFDFRETDFYQVVDYYTGAHFIAGEYGAILLGGDIAPYSYDDILRAEVITILPDYDGKVNITIII